MACGMYLNQLYFLFLFIWSLSLTLIQSAKCVSTFQSLLICTMLYILKEFFDVIHRFNLSHVAVYVYVL